MIYKDLCNQREALQQTLNNLYYLFLTFQMVRLLFEAEQINCSDGDKANLFISEIWNLSQIVFFLQFEHKFEQVLFYTYWYFLHRKRYHDMIFMFEDFLLFCLPVKWQNPTSGCVDYPFLIRLINRKIRWKSENF